MTTLAQMDVATMVLWTMVILAVVAVLFFLAGFIQQGQKSKRIKQAIGQRRGELSAQQLNSLGRPSAVRQRKNASHIELIQKILSGLKLGKILRSSKLRQNLAMAGLRGKQAVIIYLVSQLAGAIAGCVGVFIYTGLMQKFPYPEFMRFVFAAAGGAVGFYLPRIVVVNKAQNRQQQMTEAFPDALDLMLICVESGLGVEMAFTRVTEEIMESCPVLAQELGLTSAELAFLGDRRQAYENFSNRTGLPAAKALATTLIQSEQYGTPVGKALQVLADEKRGERMSAAERKAAALPAKLTVPMIIFFLPVLFIVVIGPAALQISAR